MKQNQSEVSVFQFKHIEVRTVERDGLIWFVASDIAKALDYEVAKDLTRLLDSDETGRHIVPTPSGDQAMTVINESGLYHALLKSRKPEAQPFRKWVTNEVLPTIRKTGSYDYSKPVAEPAYTAPKVHSANQLFQELVETTKLIGLKGNAALIAANQGANKVTGINMLELLGTTHLLADPRGRTYTPTQLSGLAHAASAQRVNILLEAGGYQTKQGWEWVPTAKGLQHGEMYDTGKRHGDGTPIKQWKWYDTIVDFLTQKAAA